eukprot:scaffold256529_cov28-Tisochrysis_lutea.AAC.2
MRRNTAFLSASSQQYNGDRHNHLVILRVHMAVTQGAVYVMTRAALAKNTRGQQNRRPLSATSSGAVEDERSREPFLPSVPSTESKSAISSSCGSQCHSQPFHLYTPIFPSPTPIENLPT